MEKTPHISLISSRIEAFVYKLRKSYFKVKNSRQFQKRKDVYLLPSNVKI